jgi:hypothetical protein
MQYRIGYEGEFLLQFRSNSAIFFGMKKVFIFYLFGLFCVSAQAQTAKTVTPAVVNSSSVARAEFMNAKYWTKIGGSEDKEHGFMLFSRNLLPNPDGQIELWVKIVPNSIEHFNRKYDLSSESAFVLQYATVDCSKNLILLERTAVYDANNNKLNGGSAELTPKSARDRVRPGSIGGEVFQGVCVKLAI